MATFSAGSWDPFDDPSSVVLEGYKSLQEETSVGLRPLTILAGTNSGGKSSSMQPLLLMKQTLENAYDPGGLLLDGPNVKITSADQIYSRQKRRADVVKSFSVALEFGRGYRFEAKMGQPNSASVVPIRQSIHTKMRPEPFVLEPDMTTGQVRSNVSPDVLGVYENIRGRSKSGKTLRPQFFVSTDRCFLNPSLRVGRIGSKNSSAVTVGGVFDLQGQVRSYLTRSIHLPGLRGNPERSYPRASARAEFPGQFQDYVAGLLHYWQSNEREKLENVAQSLEALGLTWKVVAKEISDTRLELLIGRLPKAQRGGSNDLVNIADVGLGASQILPVLVALQEAGSGRAIIIEQPEIHLHPRAQVRLGFELVKAATRGGRIIVETHSSLLIQGIQTAIAQGALPAKDVALHWFSRHAQSGMSVVSSASLDDDGSFGSWPVDFDDVELSAGAAYLDAVGLS